MPKGVSSIISALLMLAVVATLGTSIMLVYSDSLNNMLSNQDIFLSHNSNSIKERFIIEFVQFNADKVTVYIRNVGQSSIWIDAISISELSDESDAMVIHPADNELSSGDVKSYELSFDFSSSTYKVTVFTTNGNKVSVYATP